MCSTSWACLSPFFFKCSPKFSTCIENRNKRKWICQETYLFVANSWKSSTCLSHVAAQPKHTLQAFSNCITVATHPPNDGLVGDFLPESDLPLQMFEIRIPCIHILRSVIPPLWRICKELPPKCLGCNCSCCYRWCNFSPPSRCRRSVAASHKVNVLNGATFSKVRVDCALPRPRTRIDETSKPNRRTSRGVFAAPSTTAQVSQTANSFRRLVQSPKPKAPNLQISCTVDEKWDNGWKNCLVNEKWKGKFTQLNFYFFSNLEN